jgi:predicted PilT family ATPase
VEKAKDASLSYYLEYTHGNILLVNIPNKDRLKTKRRRNYDKLAYFMKYIHGNVEVKLMNTGEVVVLLLYCTKYLVKSKKYLDEIAKRMFLK